MTQKGRDTNPRAHQNVETWSFVKNLFLAHEDLSWEQLNKACLAHNHPAGGDAFIRYMERNKWIVAIR